MNASYPRGLRTRAMDRFYYRNRPDHTRGRGNWTVVMGVLLSVFAGMLAGVGGWYFALLIVGALVFTVVAVSAPEKTALALIVLLPFMFYPVSVRGFSIFLALPTFGFTAVILLTRTSGSLSHLRRVLPIPMFGLLFAIALVTALLSADQLTSLREVVYLALFGLFALALAASIAAGRLKPESLVRAIVYSGALAAAAVTIQFAAQFGSGRQPVIDWLQGVFGLFGGERAAAIGRVNTNWVVHNPELLRGIFPFMSPPVAGQYLMLAFVAAVWLRQEKKTLTQAGAALELVLAVAIGVGLLTTLSRQAWVGAAVGVLALGLRRRPALMMGIVVGCLLVFAAVPIPGGRGTFIQYLFTASDPGTASGGTRLAIWDQALGLIPGHALLGVGPGLYGTLNPDPSNPVYYGHNVFLDAAVETGIAGGLALLAVFVIGMRSALRRGAYLAFALLVSYVVANLFDDVFYFPKVGLLLAAAFALIAAGESAMHPSDDDAHEDRAEEVEAPAPEPQPRLAPARR